MRRVTIPRSGWFPPAVLVSLALLAWVQPARAQMQSGGFGGNGGQGIGGGFNGSSAGFGGSSAGFSGSSGGFSGSGTFSGSSGGTFSGSSGTFSGSSGGFNTTSGTSFRTTAGNAASATGVSPYTVSTSNAFGTYYANPLAVGMPGGTGRYTFGQPLYNISTLTSGTTGSNFSSSFGSNLGAQATFSTPYTSSFTPSNGGQRSVPYVAELNFGRPRAVVTTGKVVTEVQGVIGRSSSLPSKDNIRVSMEGDVVVLQGTVSDDHERRLAAGLVSLTPGVHGVRNELKLQGEGLTPVFP